MTRSTNTKQRLRNETQEEANNRIELAIKRIKSRYKKLTGEGYLQLAKELSNINGQNKPL